MDYQKKYHSQLKNSLFLAILIPMALALVVSLALIKLLNIDVVMAITGGFIVGLIAATLTALNEQKNIRKPLDVLSEAISYASGSSTVAAAPDTEQAMIGRELIQSLSLQLYSLAGAAQTTNISKQTTQSPSSGGAYEALIRNNPIPTIGLDKNMVIQLDNPAFAQFLGAENQNLTGQNFNDIVDLQFPGEVTLESWLSKQQQNAVVANNTWQRVRIVQDQTTLRQFDLVAGFSKDSASGVEVILSFFDRSETYNRDDLEVGFVSMAVHELRTPLTVLRGYIEVFQDEVGPNLNPEMQQFLEKMQASALQLTAFVSNILNLARVEENQLALKLREESMEEMLRPAIDDLRLRATVQNKNIELAIDEGIPSVGADQISVNEIINNLVDNAIKYSPDGQKIVVHSFVNSDGMVQVDVQDFGIGVPESVMPTLFEKFHRSHKSRVQVGGTGLGLYLCKSLVRAHGGNIWVRSKEGEGAIFSFTLLPFSQIESSETEGEDGIIRGAHGWIKNHSLYRN